MSERVEFKVDGKSYTCRRWNVGDFLDFGEIQNKLEATPPDGKSQISALKLLVDYILGQTDVTEAEVRAWPHSNLVVAIQGILAANGPPKSADGRSAVSVLTGIVFANDLRLYGAIPAADRALILDFFGERYGWTPDVVDSLPWIDAQLLMKTVELKGRRMEAQSKPRHR